MDGIKEAFQKVKKDIDDLKEELSSIKENLDENKEGILKITKLIEEIAEENKKKQENSNENSVLDLETKIPTHLQQNQTNLTRNPTDNFPYKPLNGQNLHISTGNRGVPTDRQTDQQTDKLREINSPPKGINSFDNALNLLNSLDELKKELRIKFKRLTDQEFLVFSTIYQFDEENQLVDYRLLSNKLNLSESSIREYIGKLIKKGIPLNKEKINNKTIHLSISQNLKKITSLPTILYLREL